MRSGKYILVILLSICTYAKYEIWEHLALTNAAKTLVDNSIKNIEKEKKSNHKTNSNSEENKSTKPKETRATKTSPTYSNRRIALARAWGPQEADIIMELERKEGEYIIKDSADQNTRKEAFERTSHEFKYHYNALKMINQTYDDVEKSLIPILQGKATYKSLPQKIFRDYLGITMPSFYEYGLNTYFYDQTQKNHTTIERANEEQHKSCHNSLNSSFKEVINSGQFTGFLQALGMDTFNIIYVQTPRDQIVSTNIKVEIYYSPEEEVRGKHIKTSYKKYRSTNLDLAHSPHNYSTVGEFYTYSNVKEYKSVRGTRFGTALVSTFSGDAVIEEYEVIKNDKYASLTIMIPVSFDKESSRCITALSPGYEKPMMIFPIEQLDKINKDGIDKDLSQTKTECVE